MLILTRKPNESIMIGDQIEISVVDIKGDQVKIGISAPKNVKVYRKEVYTAIQEENIAALKAQPSTLPELGNLFIQPKKDEPEKKTNGNPPEDTSKGK